MAVRTAGVTPIMFQGIQGGAGAPIVDMSGLGQGIGQGLAEIGRGFEQAGERRWREKMQRSQQEFDAEQQGRSLSAQMATQLMDQVYNITLERSRYLASEKKEEDALDLQLALKEAEGRLANWSKLDETEKALLSQRLSFTLKKIDREQTTANQVAAEAMQSISTMLPDAESVLRNLTDEGFFSQMMQFLNPQLMATNKVVKMIQGKEAALFPAMKPLINADKLKTMIETQFQTIRGKYANLGLDPKELDSLAWSTTYESLRPLAGSLRDAAVNESLSESSVGRSVRQAFEKAGIEPTDSDYRGVYLSLAKGVEEAMGDYSTKYGIPEKMTDYFDRRTQELGLAAASGADPNSPEGRILARQTLKFDARMKDFMRPVLDYRDQRRKAREENPDQYLLELDQKREELSQSAAGMLAQARAPSQVTPLVGKKNRLKFHNEFNRNAMDLYNEGVPNPLLMDSTGKLIPLKDFPERDLYITPEETVGGAEAWNAATTTYRPAATRPTPSSAPAPAFMGPPIEAMTYSSSAPSSTPVPTAPNFELQDWGELPFEENE